MYYSHSNSQPIVNQQEYSPNHLQHLGTTSTLNQGYQTPTHYFNYNHNSNYNSYYNSNQYLSPYSGGYYSYGNSPAYYNTSYPSPISYATQHESIDLSQSSISPKTNQEDSYAAESSIDLSNRSIGSHVQNENIKCEVCGVQATGFHYGAYCCQACKLFFTRMSKNTRRRKIEPCEFQNCKITSVSRSDCTICRFNKCKAVGMSLVGRSRFGRSRRGINSDIYKPSLNSQLSSIYTETHRRFLNILNSASTEPVHLSSLAYIIQKFFNDSRTTIGSPTALATNDHARIILLFSIVFQVNIDCLFVQNILNINHSRLKSTLQGKVAEIISYIAQPVSAQFKLVLFIYITADVFHVMDVKIRDQLYSQLVTIQSPGATKQLFSTNDNIQFYMLDDSTQKNLNKVTTCISQIVDLLFYNI